MKFSKYVFAAILSIASIGWIASADAGEVELAWEAPINSPDFEKYRIYWSDKKGVYSQYKEISKSETSTTITNLENKKLYYFVATTVTSSGMESTYSEDVDIYLNGDTDQDGISDNDEINVYGSDPNRADTDGDGIDDGQEANYWQEAWHGDVDGDSVINLLDWDADGDGAADGKELEDGTDPGDDKSVIDPGQAMMQWIEAEAHDGNNFSPLEVVQDASASCGSYIEVAAGNNAYNAAPSDGYADYDFSLAEASRVAIWLRVRIPEPDPGSNDSFWVDVSGDDSSWYKYNGIGSGVDWHWVEWTERVGYKDLAAGAHTLSIAYREDGAMLDKLLITTDLSFQPTDAGPGDCAPSATQFIEAENHHGALFSPYTVRSDSSASGGRYIVVPNGTANSYHEPPLDGAAEYDFYLPAASTVAIWLRVRIPEPGPGANDSLWLDLDRDSLDFQKWNGIPQGTDWHWVEWTAVVNPIDLPAGAHTLEMAYREDGLEIDQIVITTDLNFVP